MQRQEIFLGEDELKEIWMLAKKADFDQFRDFFSKGLYAAIESIPNSKEEIHKNLYLAAACGDYDKFVHNFEKGHVRVDEYYILGRGGKTFLQIIFENDPNFYTYEKVLSRQNLVRYLLNKGASINIRSYDESGNELPSLLELYNEQLKHDSGSWHSIWSRAPTYIYGKNVFAVLKEYLENISQPILTHK